MIRKVKVNRAKNPYVPTASASALKKTEEDAIEEVLKLERTKRAVELAITGKLTFSDIGKTFDPPIPAASIKRMVTSAIKETTAEKAETLRGRHQMILDELKDKLFEQITVKNNLNASDKLLAALKAERELNGLNAPIEIAHVNLVTEVLSVIKEIVTPSQYTEIVTRLAQIDSRSGAGQDISGGEKPAPLGLPN